MRCSDLINLLERTGNKPYLLEGKQKNKKVIVSPSLVGRVLGSTVGGKQGNILGWINQEAIEKGPVDPVFNNFGGEERFWFAPEGGQFGLNMGKHISSWQHYNVQHAFTRQPFKVVAANKKSINMQSKMKLTNAAGTQFVMDVDRTVHILEACPYTLGLGDKTDFVGFETVNVTTNAAKTPVLPQKGALGMFCLTQFLAHPHLVIIVPFRPGSVNKLGPAVRKEYFKDFCLNGKLPSHRYHIDKNFALMKADGKVRGKFGVGRTRAVPRLASINLKTNELIIVDCDFYPELQYAGSYWHKMKDPYDGDVVSVSYEGPMENGQPGKAYELETLSPALFLRPGQSFSHRNRIFHIFASAKTLDSICQKYLGVDRATLAAFDRKSKKA